MVDLLRHQKQFYTHGSCAGGHDPATTFLDIGIEDSRDKTTAKLKLAAQAALEVTPCG
jgi:hypothetical protein